MAHPPKLKSLEMLRGVASVLVVLYHTQSIIGRLAHAVPFAGIFFAGLRGVDLFFVLSGFIIPYAHARDLGNPARLGNYVFNRVSRIYPAVWIVSLGAAVLYLAQFGAAAKAVKLSGWNVVASLLLLPQSADALVNVTWTLKYEMFFYAVFAVLIANVRIGAAGLAGWQLAVLAASLWLRPGAWGVSGFYLQSICLDFGVGIACAELLRWPAFTTAMRAAVAQWSLLGAGVLAFVAGMASEGGLFTGIACGLGSGATISGLTLLEQSGRLTTPAALVRFGSASFSIYLVHYSVITLMAWALVRMHALSIGTAEYAAVGAAAISIAIGMAFDQWVDQPLQRLLRRLKPLVLGGSGKLGLLSLL
jgi:peptidoglycan/LPS O-acetylase OafA/YrhL